MQSVKASSKRALIVSFPDQTLSPKNLTPDSSISYQSPSVRLNGDDPFPKLNLTHSSGSQKYHFFPTLSPPFSKTI